MNNDLYLIHGEDHARHIRDKLIMYAMIKQMGQKISELPSNRGSKPLSEAADRYCKMAEDIFNAMGISKHCLLLADLDDLAYMVADEEMIDPEEAGYFPCDDDCCCGDCEDCCMDEDTEDMCESVNELANTMIALSSVIHSIFGDDISVHFTVE